MSMAAEHEWDDSATRLEHLGRQLSKGRLCLVLGAGISSSWGVPQWEALADALFLKKGATRTGRGALRDAEYLRSKYYAGNTPAFLSDLHDALYGGVKLDLATIRRHHTMGAIGALVMSSVRGSAPTVVTLNFDDLLETYLEYHGVVVDAVAEANSFSGRSDVEVLHPHGLVPSAPHRSRSKDVVLDEASYGSIIGNAAHPWRQRILPIMRSRTCIFVGLSGTDQHLAELLTNVRDTPHAALESGSLYWGVWLTRAPHEADALFWSDRKVKPVSVADYDEALATELFEICRRAATTRTIKSP